MKLKILAIVAVLFFGMSSPSEDEALIRNIFNAALTQGTSYENLREICKNVGHRLTGSKGDTMAVRWSENKLKEMGYSNVQLQPFETNFWTRGKGSSGKIIFNGQEHKIAMLSLGSSVGTDGKLLRGEVVEISNWEELETFGEDLRGKIVFYNRPMNPKNVNTFMSYGESVDQRSKGAVEAAKYGALASVVRSMTLSNDNVPHTGNMNYSSDINKIPGLAISVRDANYLHDELLKNERVEIEFSSFCKNLGNVESNNVMGEIKGSEFPEKIIVVGAHLDSWDVGEGAHDDGAGVVHAMEVIHLFKQIGYKPRHTIRCVLYMNEENGVGGGKKYAQVAKEKGEVHIAAIESDAGAFTPRGFHVDGIDEVKDGAFNKLLSWQDLFTPYNLHYFNKMYAGTDIGPLKPEGTVLFGLIPDSQRYFDFHHTSEDVFEAVHKRELELGCASIASLIYLIDKYGLE